MHKWGARRAGSSPKPRSPPRGAARLLGTMTRAEDEGRSWVFIPAGGVEELLLPHCYA